MGVEIEVYEIRHVRINRYELKYKNKKIFYILFWVYNNIFKCRLY